VPYIGETGGNVNFLLSKDAECNQTMNISQVVASPAVETLQAGEETVGG